MLIEFQAVHQQSALSPQPKTPFWTGDADRGSPTISKGVFSDLTWDLAETCRQGDHQETGRVHWGRFPESLRMVFKVLGWLMINNGVPSRFVSAHGKASVSNLSPSGNRKCISAWAQFVEWLMERGIHELSEISSEVWLAYADEKVVQTQAKRQSAMMVLLPMSRFWILSELLNMGIPRPPWWGTDDLDEFLPSERRRAENLTSVIPINVMSPILKWAIMFVDEFSSDIIRAKTERDSIRDMDPDRRSVGRAGPQRVKAWFQDLVERGEAIPCKPDGSISLLVVGSQIGIGSKLVGKNITEDVKAYSRRRPGPCPLNTAIQGRRTGKAWISAIDFHEVDEYWRLLGTAALICIGYLTGMRLNELLSLRVACCQKVPSNDHWIIRGQASRKTSRALLDETGQSEWIAIDPVARAVSVLERMVGETGPLFSSAKLDGTPQRSKSNQGPLSGTSVNSRLRDFQAFVEAQEHTSPIALAPAVGVELHYMRFRRTLAYYIARRPGGMVALAIQYNHMRWATSEGYASRRRDGFAAVLDIETSRAAADTLSEIAASLGRGENISGPAGEKITIASNHFVERFPGRVLTKAEALRFMQVAEHRVYLNPDFFSLCHFDPEKALCRRKTPAAGPESPSLSDCQPACGNRAYTNGLMERAAKRALMLEQKATDSEVSPFIADRFARNASTLRELIRRHQSKR